MTIAERIEQMPISYSNTAFKAVEAENGRLIDERSDGLGTVWISVFEFSDGSRVEVREDLAWRYATVEAVV